jgi:hypothetical protein
MPEKDEITRQIEERRKDPEFQRRLDDAMERSREALDLLAKGDEEQPDEE